ncbi:MAG: response regulator [Acidobacteriota bacterium]
MPKTLLLADDSVTIQRVIELTFAHEDVRVVSVSDGRRAVQWLESEWPDIVLADVDVPEVDGYELTSYVKSSPRLKDVPVLLLAGAFEPIDQERVQALRCDGVLVKPFEPQQLISRVKALLDARVEQPVGAAAGSADRMEYGREHGRRGEAEPATITPFPVPSPTMRMTHGGADPATVPETLEPPARPVWELGLPDPVGYRPADAPTAPAAAVAAASATAPKVSLVSAFSALLAAEQSTSAAPVSAAPITEATVEDAVRRVLVRMTDDLVRRIVLETAERLIREEIEKIKANPE